MPRSRAGATTAPNSRPPALRARWLDAGRLAPFDLHAFYHGIAYALNPGDDPVLIWGRADRAHISLGPHQDAATELALDGDGRAAGMEVVRRETGGGSVLVAPDQWVYAFVVPRRSCPGRPQDLYGQLLPAVETAYARFGLTVTRRGPNDLWCDDRKIAGTGMATMGEALVLVGSFLMGFDAERFAAAVDCPSPVFRRFLAAGLAEAVAPWTACAPPPGRNLLRCALRLGAARDLGWVVTPDRPGERERAAIAEARADLLDPDWRWERQGRRAVAEGIKLKADSFLTERTVSGVGRVTVQTEAGRIRRLEVAGVTPNRPASCIGLPVAREALAGCLGAEAAAAVAAVAVTSEGEGARGGGGAPSQEDGNP
ncbi:lipoate--protein ligase family protein [Thiohalorhabdus sp.]|uniref:lipoate--protein ligase family protein n=1 Tax=Thiohalorhabdus sp. TaxID=3094134 RepID=UPI002FC3AAF7